jgi:imidazolonepropionase-like amidohydrolase
MQTLAAAITTAQLPGPGGCRAVSGPSQSVAMTWIARCIAGLSAAAALISAQAKADDVILIEGARVFDGTGARAKIANVLIDGDRIAAVGPNVQAPATATRVDGRGKTLIPGLHDLHTHARSPAYDGPEDLGKAWAGYLLAGVTTINDYSVSGEMIAPIRELVADPGAGPTTFGRMWAPHLNQAIRFGVPRGHGTEAGWGTFFTLQTPTARAAHQLMPLALSYDPDMITGFADGWRYGRDPDLMSMNEPTLAAIVADAHAAGKPVVTHTVTLEGAKVAAAAGVDSVGHGVGDELVDDELIGLMRKNRTAYIATLAVYEPQQVRVMAAAELAALNPGQRAAEKRMETAADKTIEAYDARRWGIMQDNIRRLKKAKIPIGIGTDAGIEGVYHGPGAIREIWLLTQLGFTPAEALIAATRTSAEIMHQEASHGTIVPGKRADLVLIDGQPDKRILDLWKVARVWVGGREAPLDELRRLVDSPAATPMPSTAMTGPIMTGAGPDGRTDLDTLPVASTDPGIDHSHLIALGGHAGESTFLAAQMGAAPRPFVQWILPLTKGAIFVADASKFSGIELKARGAGGYRLVLESYGADADDWFAAPFAAGDGTKIIRISFAAFESGAAGAQLDLTQLRALRIQLLGQTGGTAALELSAVRFY